MTEIPKDQLQNYFNQEIIIRENNHDNVCVFSRIESSWLCGVSLTNRSAIKILINSKNDEHENKYYLK